MVDDGADIHEDVEEDSHLEYTEVAAAAVVASFLGRDTVVDTPVEEEVVVVEYPHNELLVVALDDALVDAAEDCNMGGMGALERRRVVKEIVVGALDTVVVAALAHRIEVAVVAAVAELAPWDAALVVVAVAAVPTKTIMTLPM